MAIARIWRGRTASSNAGAYADNVQKTGVEAHRGSSGNLGDFVLRRAAGDEAEFLVISLWDSMESVERYAGPDPERAVYYPEDEGHLLELEPKVRHYEVVYRPSP